MRSASRGWAFSWLACWVVGLGLLAAVSLRAFTQGGHASGEYSALRATACLSQNDSARDALRVHLREAEHSSSYRRGFIERWLTLEGRAWATHAAIRAFEPSGPTDGMRSVFFGLLAFLAVAWTLFCLSVGGVARDAAAFPVFFAVFWMIPTFLRVPAAFPFARAHVTGWPLVGPQGVAALLAATAGVVLLHRPDPRSAAAWWREIVAFSLGLLAFGADPTTALAISAGVATAFLLPPATPARKVVVLALSVVCVAAVKVAVLRALGVSRVGPLLPESSSYSLFFKWAAWAGWALTYALLGAGWSRVGSALPRGLEVPWNRGRGLFAVSGAMALGLNLLFQPSVSFGTSVQRLTDLSMAAALTPALFLAYAGAGVATRALGARALPVGVAAALGLISLATPWLSFQAPLPADASVPSKKISSLLKDGTAYDDEVLYFDAVAAEYCGTR